MDTVELIMTLGALAAAFIFAAGCVLFSYFEDWGDE